MDPMCIIPDIMSVVWYTMCVISDTMPVVWYIMRVDETLIQIKGNSRRQGSHILYVEWA